MKTTASLLTFAALLTVTGHAQQPPQPQTPQGQVQSEPCVTTSGTPNPSGKTATIKVPGGKWREILDRKLHKIEDQTGVSMSDVATDIAQAATAKPAPCPPQAAAQKVAQAIVAPVLKLPVDVTAVLHCNPMSPSASGRPTTLTLPDPHEFAPPKPTDFLVDSVIPDLAAKTPCYLVKVDPKTNKSFLAQ